MQAYKGYLVGQTLAGETFIQKDGALIGWAKDENDAHAIIDSLTTQERS